ncbi:hypothetical protein HWV62_24133 [Athelia sp. TMB]|nr:hypothetical protein HWV62_24133 [Athelia sp. TMB]
MQGSSAKRSADDILENAAAKKTKATGASLHPLFSSKIQGTSVAHPTFRWIKPNLGENKSLLHGINLSPKSCSKVAVFDLDGTVIVQQHWSKANEGQWKWWNSKVPLKLKELHNDGFSIVIISNQGQRNAGALKAWETQKIPNMATACPDLPFRIFGAKEKDGFRKPMPGVWYELQRIFAEDGVAIDNSASFFVGDAAGRSTDFASSDRKWAENVDLDFKTPELGIPVRCFKFEGTAELAWHNNLYRAYNMPPSSAEKEPKRELLPYGALASYANAFEEPTLSEGFSEIKTVNWVFQGSEEARKRWSMWLQLDESKCAESSLHRHPQNVERIDSRFVVFSMIALDENLSWSF